MKRSQTLLVALKKQVEFSQLRHKMSHQLFMKIISILTHYFQNQHVCSPAFMHTSAGWEIKKARIIAGELCLFSTIDHCVMHVM